METYRNVVYQSNVLLMIEDYGKDRFYIINIIDDLGLTTTMIKIIDTYTDGLTNKDIEESIYQVLDNGSYLYDIEHEIELYRNSEYYQIMLCNDEN